MRKVPRWLALGLILVAPPAFAQTESIDSQRSAWAYRRSLGTAPGESAFVSVSLPPELLARCQPDAADLRLIDASGREVVYLLDRADDRELRVGTQGTLVDTRRESRLHSVWTVDLGGQRRFDEIVLETPATNFAKAIRIEASGDGLGYDLVRQEAAVFDRPWRGGRQRHTRVGLNRSLSARYLRLTADDRRSPPIEVTGIEVEATRALAGEEWSREARLSALPGEGGSSRYRIEGVDGLPFETLSLHPEDAAFWRSARVLERSVRNARSEERELGAAVVFKVRLEDEALSAESLTLPVRPPSGGEIVLEIRDEDSPPLRLPRVRVSAAARRLVFQRMQEGLTLYYGNPVTRAARYDLQRLRARIAGEMARAEPALGPEQPNPRFQAPQPLAFTPQRGAALEGGRWSRERALQLRGRIDLYTLTLQATDLAFLRGDLGDLRVVDDEDVQVPFVAEPNAAQERVELQLQPPIRRREPVRRTSTSRHLILAPVLEGDPAPPPLASLEIEVREGFFTRPFRIVDPRKKTGRRDDPVVATGMLQRSPDEGGARPPLEIKADGLRHPELELEIDEGDNAPLTVQRVRAVVPVPRIVFKAAPGQYRLLLGNPDAPPPEYDIAGLRSEFLTYSATTATAGPLRRNLRHARGPGDFMGGQQNLLLWSALGLSVVVLLFVTVRTLMQPRRPPRR